MNLATRSKALLDALSSLCAGVIDDARTLMGLKPFKGEYVAIDAWLPAPRLSAARRLVAADPAAWCPLADGEAAMGLAGPVEVETSPPWRYRLVIARRADLLAPGGHALRERRIVDEATGLTLTLTAPRRPLSPGEARGLLASCALVLSLSWALTGAAVYAGNAARTTTETARALAASASSPADDTASRHTGALLRAITDHEGQLAVASIWISADGAMLIRPDGISLVPVDDGEEPASHGIMRAEGGHEP
ncbi:MAG: hypothetical protein CMM62_00030 [Rhodospirillaceae bacterium]|nr:hypothetical protein [Rhodospirillaceae bacterium]